MFDTEQYNKPRKYKNDNAYPKDKILDAVKAVENSIMSGYVKLSKYILSHLNLCCILVFYFTKFLYAT